MGRLASDPDDVSRSPWSYQAFIQKSKAEFSVAKHGYVISKCGWFSERSACYLASGRPVLVQDTGFTQWLAPEAGVVAFTSLEQAVAGIEDIQNRYAFHCQAARDVAATYFDASQVLGSLVERALNGGSVG